MSTTLIVGCGYLGRRVAPRLAAQGERVLGTSRSESGAEALRALDIEPVRLDVAADIPPGAVPAVDRVLYCIGYDRSAGVPLRTVYVDGLARFLAALPGSPHLVYASSTGVYGGSGGAWIDESTPAEPPTESGRACLDAEGLVLRHAAERGTTATILRLAGLYGPGRIIRRDPLRRGDPIGGDPAKFVNLVHIDDAADAAVAALRTPGLAGVFNIVDDRPVSRLELYTLAARLLGAPEPTFVPLPPGAPDEADKRVRGARFRAASGRSWTYPDVTTGLPAALAAEG